MDYNKEELKNRIHTDGCYTNEENLSIYEQWFAHGPRYLFCEIDKKYSITRKILCDVGCSYGTNLFYCAPGSYGIEIDERKVKFASSIGLRVHKRDAMHDELNDLPKVDIVWCSAVLEHIDSPHIFLRKLNMLLKPKGLLILYVPVIPILPFMRNIPGLGKYVSGYEGRNHIYAFVPSTLRFTCERAGFRTVEISPFYPGILRFFQHFPLVSRITGRCLYVGSKTGSCS